MDTCQIIQFYEEKMVLDLQDQLGETRNGVPANGLEVDKSMFKMSPGFTVGMLIVLSIIAALYTVFW